MRLLLYLLFLFTSHCFRIFGASRPPQESCNYDDSLLLTADYDDSLLLTADYDDI